MRVTWLPDVLRAAGLTVVEEPGWRTRGDAFTHDIAGIIGHHTASARTSGNCASTRTLIVGRPDLDGPLAQCQLCRLGEWHMIASGMANHAGSGIWPRGQFAGNRNTIGVEAENNGLGTEPWRAVQMESFVKGSAAILMHLGKTEEAWCAHYEWALPRGRKPDPRGPWENGGDWYSGRRWEWGHYEANAELFRARLRAAIEGDDEMWTPEERQKLLDGADAALYNRHLLDDIIRPKLDQVWADVKAFDHPEVLAGKVQHIDTILTEFLSNDS